MIILPRTYATVPKFVGKYMHRWLQDNPHTDEDGKPMEMGEASKG